MMRPGKIVLLAIGGLLFLAALGGIVSRKHSAQANLEQTRLALRQQGFKLDLAEFNFTVSVQESARAFALDEAGAACHLLLAEAIELSATGRHQRRAGDVGPTHAGRGILHGLVG